jgi:SOS-response transcriptional repressor LexA
MKLDKATLIRRATLDLTGLPPTPAEVQAFVNDASPDAYERLLDRLIRVATLWRKDGDQLAGQCAVCRQQRLPERWQSRHLGMA